MKKILLTGSSGFMGSNILPFLKEEYLVYAPKRIELDVRNREQVHEYLSNEYFDVIVHFASPSPVRSAELDSYENLFEDSLKIFMNFYTVRHLFGKMLYSGSGAEFDKRRDICNIQENQIGEAVPVDSYGLSKYIINELASQTDNIYNLRIFACYGPGEYDSKFITHCIKCCLNKEPITIRQDCYFDYLYVEDYARYLRYFIENTPCYHDYNVVSGKRIKLSSIAKLVCQQLENPYPIKIFREGFNKEYTADATRIQEETGIKPIISIETGIKMLSDWEKKKR